VGDPFSFFLAEFVSRFALLSSLVCAKQTNKTSWRFGWGEEMLNMPLYRVRQPDAWFCSVRRGECNSEHENIIYGKNLLRDTVLTTPPTNPSTPAPFPVK